MDKKKNDKDKSLDYLYGYRDALEDVWEDVLKMATKGYSSHELQIVAKSKAYSSKKKIDDEITKVEIAHKGPDTVSTDAASLPPMPADLDAHVSVIKNLRPGLSYIVKEPKPARIFEIFQKEINAGKPGLCIIRMSPRQVKERYGLGSSRMIWLTRSEKTLQNLPPSAIGLGMPDVEDNQDEEYIDPSSLPKLFTLILAFLDEHEGGLVMFEGVEYMISHNKFSSVMNFIQKMNEHVVTSKANLMISINPQTMEHREFSLLEREMSEAL